ncbi:resolvase [Caulobacter vibrioides]|uniref:Resolvase n=1 Tax=Caulobacter vibrioides TaxID=155892 RepID=A0A290MPZ3_CAUVI|nr:recombinase family protein [Caulobacter vibrioides]ATC34128.1 resolvase [Caulobacter vibrioides]
MTMRVAIYARYSDDKQNPGSIADQLALCRRHARARGWTIINEYTDAAISADLLVTRPGAQALLRAAETGAFDLILVEHQDRLFRNLAENATAFKRLTYFGVGIATLAKDRLQLMDIAIEGLMSELYLQNLSDKTKRGMHSNGEKGLSMGGRVYGYRSTPGGEMTIVEDEAAIVRTAFGLYNEGWSCRDIADHFNKGDTPGPTGGLWNASAFSGSRQRGNGILRCELYVGVKVWNRFDKSKDPDTGKRVQTIKPEGEWKRTPVPQLRIIDDATWSTAQERLAITSETKPSTLANQAKPGVFTGLLKCGACGENYIVAGRARLQCSTIRNKGRHACANGRTVGRAAVEDRILTGLKDRLLSPEAAAIYVRAYHERWKANAGDRRARRAPLERRLAETQRRIDRALNAILDGYASADLKTRLQSLEDERDALKHELASIGDDDPITLHPGLADVYAQRISDLQERLAAYTKGKPSPKDRQAIAAARALVDRIEIMPTSHARGAHVEITLFGDLARFLRPDLNEAQCMSLLVAGAVCKSEPTSVLGLVRVAV